MSCSSESGGHYYLRLSLTEACAFRCPYCLPEGPGRVTPKGALLAPAEIARVVGLLARQGVNRVRLTGGEPLARPECEQIVAVLRQIPGIREIALTSNAEHLAPRARALKQAGLDRVNIHLDSLDPARFVALARRCDLATVLEALAAALEAGLTPVKINTVVMRAVNDGEIYDLTEFAARWGVTVRFIELMNTGSAPAFFAEHFISAAEIRARLAGRYALSPRFEGRGAAPAEEWDVDGGRARVGFIASESEPFCERCNRLRLSAGGRLSGCLYEPGGVDLRRALRSGVSDEELRRLLAGKIAAKRSHHPAFGQSGERPFSMSEVGG